MKKMLSVLVAITLLFTICIPAFAGANVDALGDAQQKEIATLVLSAINLGNKLDTTMERSAIVNTVVNGISDFAPYKAAYDSVDNSTAINTIVTVAVNAVKADVTDESVGFTSTNAAILITAITNAITSKVAPETTTQPTTPSTEPESGSQTVIYIVDLLAKLSYEQISDTLISLVGNKALTVADATIVINALYARGTITLEQRDALLKAIVSDEASTNVVDKFFQDYTPTDLSQLFRGFGDSIGKMTSALADLFRSASGGSGSGSTTTKPSGSGSSASDIPATGDYAIPAVAAIAVAAGLALVLTKKKKDD